MVFHSVKFLDSQWYLNFWGESKRQSLVLIALISKLCAHPHSSSQRRPLYILKYFRTEPSSTDSSFGFFCNYLISSIFWKMKGRTEEIKFVKRRSLSVLDEISFYSEFYIHSCPRYLSKGKQYPCKKLLVYILDNLKFEIFWKKILL